MYASEMREQNDISLIIGHLPKRLREKIMPNWVHHGDVVSNLVKSRKSYHSKGLKQPYESVVRPNDKVLSINYFLSTPLPLPTVGRRRYDATPVSESRGMTCSVQHGYENNTDNDENVDTKSTLITIPGVLYLKNSITNILKKNDTQSTMVNDVLPAKHKHVKQNSYSDITNSPLREFVAIDRPVWMNDLNDSYVELIFELRNGMIKMMSENNVIQNWTKFYCIHAELRKVFLKLLVTYTKLCCEKKIDNFFWKVLYYNVREYLKELQPHENTQEYIILIIEDGLEFYQELYEQLQTSYLSEKPNIKSLAQYYNKKHVLVAKVIAQRALISLGDLWRYKTKEIKSQDYTKAMKYYEQAQAVLPSNGIPYNQLALISIYYRQKFDAIYYYVRSLMSSSAILSARENLLILFDEIRKKYKETTFYASQVHNYDKSKASNVSKASKCIRKEIWIYPDGVRRLHRTKDYEDINGTVDFEEQNLKKTHPKELSRHFTLLYVYIIGILYTGIGMETIQETQRILLLQLKVLLTHHMAVISRSKLLKLIVLNIFVLESSLSKGTLCQYALNFCNQIFGCILQKTNEFLKDFNNNEEQHDNKKIFLNLNSLLQYIRIYMMWLSTHMYVWETRKPNEYTSTDYWEDLSRFFHLIKHNNYNSIAQDDVVFEEDIFLAGFSPLSLQLSYKHDNVASEAHVQFYSRLLCIIQFEELFFNKKEVFQSKECTSPGTEHFNINVEVSKQQVSIATSNDKIKDIVKNSLTCVNGEGLQEKLNHLTELKKNLEAQSNAKEIYLKKLEEILKCAKTSIYVEVRPKYLLPDTNCFIDCVEDLENIIKKYNYYRLIIPLTVIRELYGLSKGVKFDHMKYSRRKERIYHYDDVSSRAKKALDIIMTSKNNIKCATTKGSIINASLYALAEEEHICNDDKILATAVALSKTMSSENNSAEDGCIIRTELLLITTDRNLRVKALSRNLVVSELSEFLEWAGNCTKHSRPNDIVKEIVNE